MTFEEYKQGFKDVAKNNDEFDIKLYNSKVSQDCDFKVRVGELPFIGAILPFGTRPSLIRAWKPLQIPMIRPSRCSSNF